MNPVEAPPVKWFAALLHADEGLLEEAIVLLAETFGPIDFRSDPFPFTSTDYYRSEMGAPLFRRFVSFYPLASPERLADVKLRSTAIEDRLAVAGRRKVNIDTGYLDFDKVVLASAKYNGDKIYIGRGIWADLTLRYVKGEFVPYPWSFPDFKMGLYNPTLLRIRTLYKKQLKEKPD